MATNDRSDQTNDTFDYILETSRDLFSTGETELSALEYLIDPNVPNEFWPVFARDCNLLRALMQACDGETFESTEAQRDATARSTARDAIRTYLQAENLPTTGWDTLVNGSQPAGGQWNYQSPDRWVHVTFLNGNDTAAIAVAPYATLDQNNEPVVRWRVPYIKCRRV